MLRFGPNGFNQSFGGRCMSKEDFVGLYNLIKSNSCFTVCDFRDVDYSKADIVYFDPPYLGTGAMISQKGLYNWGVSDDKDLLELICVCLNKGIILSTIEGSFFHQNLSNLKCISIDKKYKVTPWKFVAKPWKEIVLTNLC